MQRFFRRCLGTAFVGGALAFGVTAYAQTAQWQIGRHALATGGPAGAPLAEQAAGPGGLLSAGYLLKVGGVDFEAVASLPAAPLHLRYDPAARDGQRLVVQAGAAEMRPALADWALKPIAALADSPYTADVSLFGDGADTDHFMYPRFHPALRDTLLGMRLLQADLILSNPEGYRQVPLMDGRPVLGAGETMPDEAASRHAADVLAGVMGSYDYQSWILTDIGGNAAFRVTADGMGSGLTPYYYFWSSRIGAAALRLVRLASLENGVTTDERKTIRPQVEAAARRFAVLERSEAFNAEPHAMPDLTARIAADTALTRALNPLVWQAVENTARYAALFRLAKQESPAEWQAFAASLERVRIQPAVPTPTSWRREE